MIVYIIHNAVNDKYYVGWTSRSFAKRWRQHYDDSRRGKRTYLATALRKYGLSVFQHEIIATVDNEKEAKRLERLWIIALRSYDPSVGYNMTYGGDGVCGTDVVRGKLRASGHRRWHKKTPAEKEAFVAILVKSNLGAKRTDEARRNISAGLKTPHNIARISQLHKGKIVSEQTRRRMRDAQLGKKASPQARAKMSQAAKARRDNRAREEILASSEMARNCRLERIRQERIASGGQKPCATCGDMFTPSKSCKSWCSTCYRQYYRNLRARWKREREAKAVA